MNRFIAQPIRPSELQQLLAWPTLFFLLIFMGIDWLGLDLKLADRIYQWGNGAWILRDHWVTTTLIHEGGRKLTGIFLVITLALGAFSYRYNGLKKYRSALWYLLTVAVVCALVINLLKEFTAMDCPWDLGRYGGNKLYHGLFGLPGFNQTPGRCFPAGHASAAYAWFGAYFVTRLHFPKFQKLAIGTVITLGLIFGVAQQLRGAHFLSHDLCTAWLCWIIASGAYWIFFRPDREASGSMSFT